MNPLRWDVLGAALLFAAPVLLLGAQGALDIDELTARLSWCLLAGWIASSLLRAALTPRPARAQALSTHAPAAQTGESAAG